MQHENNCKQCGGRGFVIHPAWRAAERRARGMHREPATMTNVELAQIMASSGYADDLIPVADILGVGWKLPDREIQCYSCWRKGRAFDRAGLATERAHRVTVLAGLAGAAA